MTVEGDVRVRLWLLGLRECLIVGRVRGHWTSRMGSHISFKQSIGDRVVVSAAIIVVDYGCAMPLRATFVGT